MNAPIVRLYGLLLLLFAALVGFTSYWAVFDVDRPQGQPREPPAADRRADGQARHDHDRRRRGRRAEPPGGRRQAPGLRPRLSAGLAVRQPGRLQLRRSRPDGDRALRERRPGRRARTSSPRSSTSSAASPQEGDNVTLTIDSNAQQVATQALQSAIASTPGAAGSGGAVVALDPSTGAVKAMASVPGLRPEPLENPEGPQAAEPAELGRADRQPRHPEHLSARLDDEGGDRRRGARLGPVHAVDASSAARSPQTIDGAAALERRRRAVRRHRHDHRADLLGQHLLRPGRRAARDLDDGRVHEALRLLQRPPARLPRRPDGAERRLQLERPPGHLGVRRRPGRDRPGRRRGAGPDDARSRWPRSPRRWPTAAS